MIGYKNQQIYTKIKLVVYNKDEPHGNFIYNQKGGFYINMEWMVRKNLKYFLCGFHHNDAIPNHE